MNKEERKTTFWDCEDSSQPAAAWAPCSRTTTLHCDTKQMMRFDGSTHAIKWKDANKLCKEKAELVEGRRGKRLKCLYLQPNSLAKCPGNETPMLSLVAEGGMLAGKG